MISTRFVKLAVSGLALGLTLTGGYNGPATQAASDSEAKQMKIAAKAAHRAAKAMAALDYAKGVTFAENAVAYQPRDPAYRMLLAQAYLGSGRFAAAGTSFSDVLALSPNDARAALNLALTDIAQGKRDAALATLSDYREKLAASDYGLAVALAGDTDTAVRVLEAAIRAGTADAKTRQNLALAYALAGKWANARVMAVQDLAPTDADARIVQWAGFVRPKSSYDQVASLIGVTPVDDAGQPTRLALNSFAATAMAAADTAVEPAPPSMPEPVAVMAQAPAAPVVEPVAEPMVMAAGVVMGERREIVQPIPAAANPAPVIRAATNAVKQAIVPRAKATPAITGAVVQPQVTRRIEAGKFVVQLGAFENAAVSRDAWNRMSVRYGLAGFDPANSAASVGGARFVRLSVGGFGDRAEANRVCTKIRSAGGTCFVRGLLGDAPAQWVQRGMPKPVKPLRVASR